MSAKQKAKHEADALKGLVTIDPKAIQTSIDHIEERRKALLGTLRPLPAGSPGAPKAAEPTAAQAAALERLSKLGVQFGAVGG